jgi:hypothetical protein
MSRNQELQRGDTPRLLRFSPASSRTGALLAELGLDVQRQLGLEDLAGEQEHRLATQAAEVLERRLSRKLLEALGSGGGRDDRGLDRILAGQPAPGWYLRRRIPDLDALVTAVVAQLRVDVELWRDKLRKAERARGS